MAVEPQSAMRADAARNREALIAAAATVFGERGIDAPLDDIARLAGVGNATLYRRFPTRCDLVEAVFAERMGDAVRAVEQALAEPDPWAGFRDYVLHLCRMQATDAGLADLFAASIEHVGGELEQLRGKAYAGVVELADRAKRDGALREDFSPEDLLLLLIANASIARQAGTAATESSERFVAVVLDGLRAGSPTPAPPPPAQGALLEAMRSRSRP